MKKKASALSQLYPFLHGKAKDVTLEKKALYQSIEQKAAHSLQVKKLFFENNKEELIAAAQALATIYESKGRVFTMGNGGSSCDASHFAVEFQHPVTAGRPALPAMNLSMDMAMISAVVNDLGAEHVFTRQLGAHARSGDGLVGFSTSGNSKNLMAAFARAKDMQVVTIGLCGDDGGDMLHSGLVDHCLHVPTESIHRVQEVHVAIYHILWDLTHTLLADKRGNLQ